MPNRSGSPDYLNSCFKMYPRFVLIRYGKTCGHGNDYHECSQFPCRGHMEWGKIWVVSVGKARRHEVTRLSNFSRFWGLGAAYSCLISDPGMIRARG